jgi:4-aminobutyrate aminotransferase-like enzyme
MLQEFQFIGAVRGLGLVCGVEIVSHNTLTGTRETKTADPAMAARIFKAA